MLKERWIIAMSRIAMSLVDGKMLKGKDGILICYAFRDTAPEHPTKETVEALEAEALGNEANTNQRRGVAYPGHYAKVSEKKDQIIEKVKAGEGIRKTSRETGVAINTVRKIVREEEYPEPWVKVKKDGVVLRYEDADGKPIPPEVIGSKAEKCEYEPD